MLCAYLSSDVPKCPNNTPLWEYTYSWLGKPSLWKAFLIGATETRHSALIISEKEIGGGAFMKARNITVLVKHERKK